MTMASGIRAGGAYVEFFINDRVTRQITTLAGRTRRAAQKMANVGGAIAGAGLALGAGLAYPIRAASQLQETMNKFTVVFGDQAKAVKAWSDQFAGSVGRSRQEIAAFMASSQDLLVPMGIDPEAAQQMSKTLTGLAVDLASFNNMADADVLRDLQAAMTGSGEVMKKYGVILTAAAVNQELLNRGLDPRTATDAAKAQARLAIVLRGTTAAQGDAVRSAGSYANQMKALRARATDAAAALGMALLPIVTPLVTRLAEAASVVGQFIQRNAGLIVSGLKVAAAIAAAGAAVWVAGSAIAVLSTMVASAAGLIGGALAGAVSLVTGAMGLLLSPIGLVGAALAGLTVAWATMTESGRATVGSLLGWFGQIKAFAVDTWQGIADALKAGDITLAANVLWTSLKLLWIEQTQGLMDIWRGLTLNMTQAFDDTITWVRIHWAKMAGWLGQQIAKVMAYFTGQDAAAMAADVQRQTAAKTKAIEAAAGRRRTQRAKAAQADFEASRAQLKALRQERAEALAAAAKARQLSDQAKSSKGADLAAKKTAQTAAAASGAASLAKALTSAPQALARGTIEAAKAAYQNRQNSTLAAIDKASKRTAENTAEIRNQLDENRIVLAPLP